jgi:ribosome biogenesis GTPase A
MAVMAKDNEFGGVAEKSHRQLAKERRSGADHKSNPMSKYDGMLLGILGFQNFNTKSFTSLFAKENRFEVDARRFDSTRVIEKVPRGMEAWHVDHLPFPVRPPINMKALKASSNPRDVLDSAEAAYMTDYLGKVYTTYQPNDLAYFEHNLEVWRQLWRVLEKAQTIICCVDARFPLLHIPQPLVDLLKEKGVPLIILLNKVDLLEPATLLAWEEYLTKTYEHCTVMSFSAHPTDITVNEETGRRKVIQKRNLPEPAQDPEVIRVLRACGVEVRSKEENEALAAQAAVDSATVGEIKKVGGAASRLTAEAVARHDDHMNPHVPGGTKGTKPGKKGRPEKGKAAKGGNELGQAIAAGVIEQQTTAIGVPSRMDYGDGEVVPARTVGAGPLGPLEAGGAAPVVEPSATGVKPLARMEVGGKAEGVAAMEAAEAEAKLLEDEEERRVAVKIQKQKLLEAEAAMQFDGNKFNEGLVAKTAARAAEAKVKARPQKPKAPKVVQGAFTSSRRFVGAYAGYEFKTGESGTGYYETLGYQAPAAPPPPPPMTDQEAAAEAETAAAEAAAKEAGAAVACAAGGCTADMLSPLFGQQVRVECAGAPGAAGAPATAPVEGMLRKSQGSKTGKVLTASGEIQFFQLSQVTAVFRVGFDAMAEVAAAAGGGKAGDKAVRKARGAAVEAANQAKAAGGVGGGGVGGGGAGAAASAAGGGINPAQAKKPNGYFAKKRNVVKELQGVHRIGTMRTGTVVGIVGQPSVGKSSVLNRLVGRKTASEARTAGHTKYFQTISLQHYCDATLVDCPGLLFPATNLVGGPARGGARGGVPRVLQELFGIYEHSQVRVRYGLTFDLSLDVAVRLISLRVVV